MFEPTTRWRRNKPEPNYVIGDTGLEVAKKSSFYDSRQVIADKIVNILSEQTDLLKSST